MSIGDGVLADSELKKSKKKKKDKRTKVEAPTVAVEQEEPQTIKVDAPEKKKKRKREENGEEEERKKKKKRKDTADVPSVEERTTAMEEKIAERQAVPEIDKQAEQRKRKALRKELKKQQKQKQKALAKAAAASKPTSTIKNTTSTEEAEKYLSENSITIHGDVVPVLDFDQLDIQPPLREVLNKFSKPTPIQACAWPALLEGKDVIGIAETGRFVLDSFFRRLVLNKLIVAKPSRSVFRSSPMLNVKKRHTTGATYTSSSSRPPVNLQSKSTIRSWRLVRRSGYTVFAFMEACPS
jgi:hypothetical protein